MDLKPNQEELIECFLNKEEIEKLIKMPVNIDEAIFWKGKFLVSRVTLIYSVNRADDLRSQGASI